MRMLGEYIVTYIDGSIWLKAFMRLDDMNNGSAFVKIVNDDKIFMVNKNTIKSVVSESGL